MTSEICIMNKHAAVLAADSAVTTTEWDGERQRTRYFKGANKIFQISNSAPIGLMIYGGSELHGVPWEILVKNYRKKLSNKDFDTSKEYAEDFFCYVRDNEDFFPSSRKQYLSAESVKNVVWNIYTMVYNKHGEYTNILQIETFIDELCNNVENSPNNSHFHDENIEILEKEYLPSIIVQINRELKNIFQNNDDNIISSVSDKLCKVAFKLLITDPKPYLPDTGIVFVGFGAKEYFSVMVEYRCYGMLFGKLLYEIKDTIAVGIDNPAWVKPFAMSEMVDTFLNGIGNQLFNFVMHNVTNMLDVYGKNMENITKDISDGIKQKFINNFFELFSKEIRNEHRLPLMRVVSSLSLNELSELAETLIKLESLKERMTKDSESVGGEVDVAVITKNEGFVWVKRKHYFDPKLNVKYFQRNLFQVE